MNTPLVSWLMPVYNAEDTLERAVYSMINQTYRNMEIVIVNDYSSDNTRKKLKQLEEEDPRIKVYDNDKNMGVALSLNRGLKLCKGKYIARMDADDYSYPQRLEKQVNFMEKHEDIGILGANVCTVNISRNLRINTGFPTDPRELKCRLLFNMQTVHPVIMFRSDTIRDLHIEYPNSPAEDYALFASLITKVKMANISDVLLDYYIETINQTTVLSKERIMRDNKKISRRAIKDTLGIDTARYSDLMFGNRNIDLVPYSVKEVVTEAKQFFNELIEKNKERRVFDPIILDYQLNKEWEGILSKIHLRSFNEYMRDSITQYIEKNSDEDLECISYPEGNVIIYGTGDFAREYVPYLEDKVSYNIVAFCDSNKKKQGQEFLGKKIIGPEELNKVDFDFIIIATPIYFDEICDMLMKEYKIAESQILDFGHLNTIKAINDRKEWNKEYQHKDTEKKVYIFCAPDYANIGDHAIAYAERKFIKEKFGIDAVEIPTRRYKEAAEIARHHIREDDLILITGGGFLGSLWMNSENMARQIIHEYPNNRIIVMPQTLYWGGSENQQKEAQLTSDIYRIHKKLTLFARDNASYELMKQYYPECDVYKAPDMVLSVNWDEFIRKDTNRTGLLLCLKDDQESILSDEQKQELCNLGQQMIGDVRRESNIHARIILEPYARYKAISEQLLKFQQSQICITDRLHGMLFSVITNTPCVVLNSCNHKLSDGFKWVKDLGYIEFANNIHEVKPRIQSLMEKKSVQYSASMFETQYYELTRILIETLQTT